MVPAILTAVLAAALVRNSQVSAIPIPTKASEAHNLLTISIAKGDNFSVWESLESSDSATAWALTPPKSTAAPGSADYNPLMAIHVALSASAPESQIHGNKAELAPPPPDVTASPGDILDITILLSTPTRLQ